MTGRWNRSPAPFWTGAHQCPTVPQAQLVESENRPETAFAFPPNSIPLTSTRVDNNASKAASLPETGRTAKSENLQTLHFKASCRTRGFTDVLEMTQRLGN